MKRKNIDTVNSSNANVDIVKLDTVTYIRIQYLVLVCMYFSDGCCFVYQPK